MTDELVTIRDTADRVLKSTPVIATTITIYGSRPRQVVLELRGRDQPNVSRDPEIVARLGNAIWRALGELADNYAIAVDWGTT